jgi:hypothetical protein
MNDIRIPTLLLLVVLAGCGRPSGMRQPSVSDAYEITGEWRADQMASLGWYISNGVPWHMWSDYVRSGRYANYNLLLEGNRFRITYPTTNTFFTGTYEIDESDDTNILLRLTFDDDTLRTNDRSKEELAERAIMAGKALNPYLGMKFLDNDTVMKFSLVVGWGRVIEPKLDGIVLSRASACSTNE